eukprot:sb/3463259/
MVQLSILQKAVTHCPKAEVLWLMRAKSKWLAGNVPEARSILNDAFGANPNSEEIWIAAITLESKNNEHERARKLLQKARETAGTARVWMKSARLEWCLDNLPGALATIATGVTKFTEFPKFYMMKGQIEIQMGKLDAARTTFDLGIKRCPNSIPLWVLFANTEVGEGNITKARSILEKARVRNPLNDELWVHAIRLEVKAGNDNVAQALLARALQSCPKSGRLWSEGIFMAPRPARKTKSVDALKNCDNDAHVVLSVAKLFWLERKNKKAREWFVKAVKLDPDHGDTWAAYYKFTLAHGTEQELQILVDKCVQADPKHGERWCKLRKAIEHWRNDGNVELMLKTCARQLPELSCSLLPIPGMKSPSVFNRKMSKGRSVVLVLSGCFNPPTMMHLRCLEIARDALRQQNINVLAGLISPVHDGYRKHKKTLVKYADRRAMVELACGEDGWIRCSSWEGNQAQWTPTRQVLEALQDQAREEFGDPGITTALVCGGDLLESFSVPGLWLEEDIESIVGRHGLVVIRRTGSDPDKYIFGHDTLYKYRSNIRIAYEPISNDISSTAVRRLVSRGLSVRYLVPDAVCDYVVSNGLYSS